MIEAVIFDMDGLLIDSEPFWQDAEMKVFSEIGFQLTREMCKETTGLRIDEVVAHYHRQQKWDLGRWPLTNVSNAIVDEVIAAVNSEGQPLPGVQQAIEICLQQNKPLALASSSNLRLIEAVLKHLNIAEFFSVVHSAEFETYGKPHPSTFLTTAEKMTKHPTECLVFEDSLNGVIAAKAARMICIAIPEAESPHKDRFTVADVVLRSLEEFDKSLWQSLNQQS